MCRSDEFREIYDGKPRHDKSLFFRRFRVYDEDNLFSTTSYPDHQAKRGKIEGAYMKSTMIFNAEESVKERGQKVLTQVASSLDGLVDSRDVLTWKTPFMSYSAYIAAMAGWTVIFSLSFDIFVPFSVHGFITSYFAIVFALAIYLFWKIFKKTKAVDPKRAHIWSRKEEVDKEYESGKV